MGKTWLLGNILFSGEPSDHIGDISSRVCLLLKEESGDRHCCMHAAWDMGEQHSVGLFWRNAWLMDHHVSGLWAAQRSHPHADLGGVIFWTFGISALDPTSEFLPMSQIQ